MEEIKGRKLQLKEFFIISRIIKEMNCKSYIEYISRQLSRNNKEVNKLKSNNSSENEIKELKEELNKNLGLDVFAFIIENIDLSKDSIYELFSSYANIEKQVVEKLDLDEVYEIFMSIYNNGLPEILINIFKKNLPVKNIL